MITQTVIGVDKTEMKTVSLNEAIFGAPVRRQLLFDSVLIYQGNLRHGTVKTKTRGEVSGTTAKMYRQKGTGNARHGDAKANLFVGGGVAFGPRQRNWRCALSKKAKKQALISALSLRRKEGGLLLVEEIPCQEIKTKILAKQLSAWGIKKGLIVVEEASEKLWKSMRNIPDITLVSVASLNMLDIMKNEKVVVTEKALGQLEKRLS